MTMNTQTELTIIPGASNGADIYVPNGTEIVSPLVGELVTQLSVPNGTDIVSPTVAELVKQYRLFAKETAENVLQLYETVAEADNKLSKCDRLKFCLEVGLRHNGSAYRKRLNIGKKVSRFKEFTDRLPSCWTTLYKLSTLEKCCERQSKARTAVVASYWLRPKLIKLQRPFSRGCGR
jgi:hypothetical protein